MAVTNPNTIGHVNDGRPLCEKLRNLKIEIDEYLRLSNLLGTPIPNDENEAIEDGREAEQVSRLDGADYYNYRNQFAIFQTQMDQPGVADVISKPCVNPIQI